MDLNKCHNLAEQMAKKAITQDEVIINGQTYILRFNPISWVYNVVDSAGNFVVNFNTKKITQAKKWLKEHLNG